MTSAILISSSSPPRMFANSPTPAESSPIQSHSKGPIANGNFSPAKFKGANNDRNGLSLGFTTARQILGTKVGAENSPLCTPKSLRFKHIRALKVNNLIEDAEKYGESINTVYEDGGFSLPGIENKANNQLPNPFLDSEVPIVVNITAKDVRRKKTPASKPLNLKKAIARRTDWTPPKSTVAEDDLSDHSRPCPSIAAQMKSFEYDPPLRIDTLDKPHAKGQKIELTASTVKRTPRDKNPISRQRTKRNPSPPKKPLTITGLATSNYLGLSEDQQTPMMQYLTSTQARAHEDDPDIRSLQTRLKSKRKSNVSSRKPQQKSRLVSPQSALKTLEGQDFIFASASQLTRDESPGFMRDTLEALKQSELHSDPIPTQQTAPISIESTTPRYGISRYRNVKNLWAAADRDEDDALLYADDVFDTPVLRDPLAGKDVPLGTKTVTSAQEQHSSKGSTTNIHDATFDIDDIPSPLFVSGQRCISPVQKRSIHTSATSSSPRRRSGLLTVTQVEVQNRSGVDTLLKSTKAKSGMSKMPAFAGMTDVALRKQLTAYGFKPIKKREKVIEMLEKCWMERSQSHQAENVVTGESESLRHGDFLSKVHDIAARPAPKAKKPRATKKQAVVAEGAVTAKKPAARKKVETKASGVENGAEKKSRKRKNKADVNEVIINIDDLGITALERLGEIMPWNGSDVPQPPPKKKRAPAKKKKEVLPATPPSTVPTVLEVKPVSLEDAADVLIPGPLPMPPSLNIDEQITSAIKHNSNSGIAATEKRNHQTNPTWYEKILMYDPIFLEDLTAWLNTEGLSKIGEDREADILEVRAWCEARGVCCLWKGGWRGQRGVGMKSD